MKFSTKTAGAGFPIKLKPRRLNMKLVVSGTSQIGAVNPQAVLC